MMRSALLGIFLVRLGFAFEAPPPDHAETSPPKVIHKVEPHYTPEARRLAIQGTVLVEVGVDEHGVPSAPAVISPIGFGLDARATEAVLRWQFQPAMKDGQPVKARTTVAVDFRLFRRVFDPAREQRRTSFNLAVHAIQTHHRSSQTLETIKNLAGRKYPPAMYLYAKLLQSGDGFPRDREQAAALIEEASDRSYPPAMYEHGRAMMTAPSGDKEKGIELVRSAAVLGHRRAQFYLGAAYENGEGVPQDAASAREYFRMCAILGEAPCQVRLAKLLLSRPDRQKLDYLQALAWLDVASDRGDVEAGLILAKEHPDLNAREAAAVKKLKSQFSDGPRLAER